QISRESRVSAPRSESNHHRYHFIASRRSSAQHSFSVLLAGRRRKLERASSGSHVHSGNKENFTLYLKTSGLFPAAKVKSLRKNFDGSGTSMATPHIAGAMALLWSAMP